MNRLKLFSIIFFFLPLQFFWAQLADSKEKTLHNISQLLPDSAGNWIKSELTEVYRGNELFRLIDGGAVIFKEYGFNQAVVQEYIDKNDNKIDVEIYEMRDSSSAYGIFSLFTFNTGRPFNFSSEASVGDGFLIFRKGNYYISLTGINLPEKESLELFLIAKKIDSLIVPSEKPKFVQTFNRLSNSKLAYFKGTLGFYNLSAIDTGEKFEIGEGIFFDNDTVRNTIIKYKTEEESKRNYLLLLEAFKNSSKYKMVNSAPETNLFIEQGSYLKYLLKKNYIIMSSSVDRVVLEKSIQQLKNLLK